MIFTDKLDSPGEHHFLLQGLAGSIEAVLSIPSSIYSTDVALLGHPHSLQGGSMTNKVVTTMAGVFKNLGIPCLRFNFRGVGQSEGTYDAGIGESDDMLALARAWQKEQPGVNFIFAGFSFGSYVAYRASAQLDKAMLITVAPPVHHYNYREFHPAPQPWLIMQGDEDEIVCLEDVIYFSEQASPAIPVIKFAHTSHFFHGKLVELKVQLMDYLHSRVHPL